ncbi:ribonuclease III [Candidatus Falkowbacteria bacterium]|nr:ribonuclease III [Candidatus Falkowbacteria bacterium]
MEKNLRKLEKLLGTKFKNKDVLRMALTHRSYLNEHPDCGVDHNERLEFLGDAVLELVVTEHLYNNYPNPEGELTNWRASLVNSKMLAHIAKEIGLEDYLFLSRGESKDKGKARQYILANAFESVTGAIYLDGGWEPAKKFISQYLLPELPIILEQKLYVDPKSYFQEKAQEEIGTTPSYKVEEEFGPDHAKTFVVGVYLKKELIATGKGLSKQEAEEHAARAGLHAKGWI